MKRKMSSWSFVSCALVGAWCASAAELPPAEKSGEAEHVISAEKPFVLVPVQNGGAPKQRFEIFDGKACVRFWDVAWGVEKADWHASLDLGAWAGKKLSFRVSGMTDAQLRKAIGQIRFAAQPEVPANVYDEPCRPQLHLSPTLGWTNDPNGLSYFNGEYHVFYQHNPCNREWKNMTWGHFVSKDLVHWTDVGDALHPDRLGTMFSGSAVVDREGTAGFGRNAHVLVYTAAGKPFVQCVAGSLDGRHYEKFAKNPVIGNVGVGDDRDPMVFWHAASRQWVMCLYVCATGPDGCKRHSVHIFNSSDLKNWKLSDVVWGDKSHWVYAKEAATDKGVGKYFYECPGLVELKVRGTEETRWVLWGAYGEYAVGTFDGFKFKQEEGRVRAAWNTRLDGGFCHQAPQAFTGDPKGRIVWLPWMRVQTPESAFFNQCFGIPMALSLRKTEKGLRMAFEPVEEYEALRNGAAVPFSDFKGELAEGRFDAKVGPDAVVTLDLRGEKIVYDAAKGLLSHVSGRLGRPNAVHRWSLVDGRLSLRFYVDRMGLEVLSGDGLQIVSFCDFFPDPANLSLSCATSGRVEDMKASAYRLKSIWRK